MTTYLGKSCSFGLPWVPFVNCRQFMYLVISLLVLRAGCGIWLYQFLIIVYLFTFNIKAGTQASIFNIKLRPLGSLFNVVKCNVTTASNLLRHKRKAKGTALPPADCQQASLKTRTITIRINDYNPAWKVIWFLGNTQNHSCLCV